MVSEVVGDMFALPVRAFAHGVNTRGVMGAGVAAQVRSRFPEVFDSYASACRSGRFQPGMVQRCVTVSGVWVYNLATQDRPGRFARLEWVTASVASMAAHASAAGIEKVGTVRLGCGIGGLDWGVVRSALELVEFDGFGPFELVVASPAG